MPDEQQLKDERALWRNQPEEKLTVNLQPLVNRRTEQLYSTTRSEIIMSVAAALFFVTVMAWRFANAGDPLQLAAFSVVITWALVTVFWFRRRIWRRDEPPADALAASGLEFYRQELLHRRDHLRSAWLWHGPLLLACLIFAAGLIGKSLPTPRGLWNVMPFLAVLLIWTVAGIWRRWRQAREIQREIDELGPLGGAR